jgi:uncharacterized protein YgbK (DUF1537 family)
MLQFAILTDDLTGGMNIGVEFAAASLRTVFVQDIDRLHDVAARADALIVDTQSRNDPPETAHAKNAQAAAALRELGPEIVVKKIDSLLRGSIGAELDAVMAAFGFEKCLLCAASPKLKRQTVGGYHLIDGEPLARKRSQLDPTSTSVLSSVKGVLSAQTDREIGQIDLDTIAQGGDLLEDAIRRSRPGILIADSVRQEDLNRVAAAAYRAGVRLFAGTYGMGEAVCRIVSTAAPVLIVMGSLSAAAGRQIARLTEQAAAAHIAIDYDRTFFDMRIEDIASTYTPSIKQALARGMPVLLQVSTTSERAAQIWEWAAQRGGDRRFVSDRIDSLLEHLVRPVLPLCAGFIASGGATANVLFRLLDAEGLRLGSREVMPGVPASWVSGGPYDGRPFIAKPGSQGTDEALVHLLQFTQSQVEEKLT